MLEYVGELVFQCIQFGDTSWFSTPVARVQVVGGRGEEEW